MLKNYLTYHFIACFSIHSKVG